MNKPQEISRGHIRIIPDNSHPPGLGYVPIQFNFQNHDSMEDMGKFYKFPRIPKTNNLLKRIENSVTNGLGYTAKKGFEYEVKHVNENQYIDLQSHLLDMEGNTKEKGMFDVFYEFIKIHTAKSYAKKENIDLSKINDLSEFNKLIWKAMVKDDEYKREHFHLPNIFDAHLHNDHSTLMITPYKVDHSLPK